MKTQVKYSIEWENWLSAMYILWIDLHYKNGGKRKIDVANYEKIATDYLCKKIPGLFDHHIHTITLVKKQKLTDDDYLEIFIDEVNI